MPNEVSRSTVHGHVIQAHELHLHGDALSHPPLTSWQDRPQLTAELEDLLHVQRDAAEALPYRLLGVKQPELARVYVQQSVRETEHKGDRPVPINDALARGNHLLITGEPGAGKSTLGQMYVQRLATEWLEPSVDPPLPEPVMPLRIPAKALADDRPWSELLADAVRDRRLNATLKPELFARRALGARWLVFVDGLDEIAEPERRDRVIEALVSRMRRSSDHRLIITTRPLPPEELQKLHGPDIGLFTIQPFGPVELQDFASAWFRAQNPTNSKDRAGEFVRQIHDGRLRELVRNPLLATIAAIASTLEPHRELPRNRADLYERFMSYLLNDKASGRTTLAELRKAHADDPRRAAQIEWLYSRREDLIEHLASERLESERPLLDVAAHWVSDPVDQDDLEAVLASTGVFVHGDSGLRFLHHSFAEFLAARLRARSIPAEFPNLDEWVDLGTQPARETSVLFTFALWGREPDHDLDLVVARLLEGGAGHALLAGRLLAEDVDISDTRSDAVVERLVKLLLANGVTNVVWPRAREIGRVLAGLGSGTAVRTLIPRLRELRDNADLPRVVRIGCAVALGHLESPEFAAKWLQDYADVRATDALAAIATGLAEILPNGADLAEDLLRRLNRTTDSYPIGVSLVSVLLFDLERRDAARELLRDLVRRMRADTSIQPGSPHVPHAGALADSSPLAWYTLASLARTLDCEEEAVWAAELVLTKPSVGIEEFDEAADVLLARGRAGLEVLVDRAMSLTLEHVLVIAEKVGAVEPLDRFVATHPAASNEQFVRACVSMVADAPDEVVRLAEQRRTLGPEDLTTLAEALSRYEITKWWNLVTRALALPINDRWEFQRVMRAVLRAGAIREVRAVAKGGTSMHRAVAAPVLYHAGLVGESSELIEALLTDPLDAQAASICLSSMVSRDVPKVAQELFDRLMAVVGHTDPGVARRLAPVLHQIGQSDEATAIAVDAFLRSLGGGEVFNCAAVVLEISGTAHADVILTKIRDSNLDVWQRMNIAELFVSEGMLDEAASIWLDVVRNHSVVIDKGVDAAARLVKVGRRQEAIDAVRNALDHDPLTLTARSTMVALLAWLEA